MNERDTKKTWRRWALVAVVAACFAASCDDEYAVPVEETSAWSGAWVDDGASIESDGYLAMVVDANDPGRDAFSVSVTEVKRGSSRTLTLTMDPPRRAGTIDLQGLGAQICISSWGEDVLPDRCEPADGTITTDYTESDCSDAGCLVDMEGEIEVTKGSLFHGSIAVVHHEEWVAYSSGGCSSPFSGWNFD